MWYVLWTNTGNEEKTRQMIYEYANTNLYSKIAIPYRLKRHWHNGKSRIVKMLLFPSYLFIESENIIDLVDNIKWFPGFNVVLHTYDMYCPLYKHEEKLLLDLLNEHEVIDISEGYMEGDQVKITKGPLLGKEGLIKRIRRRQGIAIIEMNIFNRVTEVSLGLDLISK